MSTEMIKIVLNGQEIEVPKGETILEAVKPFGVDIPHYCYHKGLSIAGNCRMCLVRTALKNPRDPEAPAKWMPKPSIACQTIVSPGMEVDTESDEVKRLREAIMEFLLINHPLDCPECDQAGECRLQDYAFAHGRDRSRFVEQKTVRHIKPLGGDVMLWGTRCIVCTRCVRFLQEVSGTGEINVIQRGDRSVVDVHPDHPVDNPLAGNVIDICPVGALVSKDFLYQARVWFMKRENSLCNRCSKGCNITVDRLENTVKRLKPRENMAVNEFWMCDYGRHGWKYIYADNRLFTPLKSGEAIDWKTAYDVYKDIVAKAKGEGFGALISMYATNEELYLLDQLARKFLGIEKIAPLEVPRQEDEIFPKFTIHGDKQPNRSGFKKIMGDTINYNAFKEALIAGEIKNLIVFSGIPEFDYDAELIELAKKAKSLIVFDLSQNELTLNANLAFPSLAFTEKAGSFVNADHIVQRFDKAAEPEFPAEEEITILQKLTDTKRILTAGGVFGKLAKENNAFSGISYQTMGFSGQKLS